MRADVGIGPYNDLLDKSEFFLYHTAKRRNLQAKPVC